MRRDFLESFLPCVHGCVPYISSLVCSNLVFETGSLIGTCGSLAKVGYCLVAPQIVLSAGPVMEFSNMSTEGHHQASEMISKKEFPAESQTFLEMMGLWVTG